MELRQLHYFVALYEEGSVTQAARRMNIVQPAISQQLSKLEDELGQSLFHRTPKGMVPTEAGEQAYRLIHPIIQDIETAWRELSVHKGSIKGHISVGAVSSVANNILADALLEFNQKYPDVSIRVTGGYSGNLLDMVRNAQLDVAIVNAMTKTTNFDLIEVMVEDFAMICGPNHPVEFRDGISLDEVMHHDLVIPSMQNGLRSVIERAAAVANLRLRPRLQFDEIHLIEDIVQRSNYISVLPPISVRQSLQSGRLRHFRLTPKMTRRIVCATSPSRPTNRITKLFIELLKLHGAGIRPNSLLGPRGPDNIP